MTILNNVFASISSSAASIVFRTISATVLLVGCAACMARPNPTPDVAASLASTSSPTISAIETPVLLTAHPPVSASPTLAVSTLLPTHTVEALNLTNPKVIVLAENLSNPDDLVLAPDGSIVFTEIGSGSVRQFLPDGKIHTILTNLNEPEGMVFLPGGTLVIAEQGKNRVIGLEPAGHTFSTLIMLENKTNQPGLDGIALDSHDPAHLSLVIPDSPNGTILRSSLDGKTVSTIARGFARPTGAWVENDGSLLVVDENAHSLTRIHPDGNQQILAQNLATPDDVIEDNHGHIFINTLGDGAIHLLSTDGRQDSVLVKGLAGPQGLCFDLDGNLVVSDSGHNRLVKIMIH